MYTTEEDNSRRYTHPNAHNRIMYNSEDMDAKCLSTDEWIYIHIHICIYRHTHNEI